MPMSIRPATLDDCSAIANVQIEGWRTTYRGIVRDEYLDAMSHERQTANWMINLRQAQQIAFVAEKEDHAVAAFANGGPERTGRSDFRGELYAIYMLEEYRRQGLGRRLFSRFVERMSESGMGSILVWVLADNPCRRFYETLGAKLVSERNIEIDGQKLREVAYGWDHVRLPETEG